MDVRSRKITKLFKLEIYLLTFVLTYSSVRPQFFNGNFPPQASRFSREGRRPSLPNRFLQQNPQRFPDNQRQSLEQFPTIGPSLQRWQGNRGGSVANERWTNNGQRASGREAFHQNRPLHPENVRRRQLQMTQNSRMNKGQKAPGQENVRNSRPPVQGNPGRWQSQWTEERPTGNRQQVPRSGVMNNGLRFSTNHPARFGSRNTQSTHNRENSFPRAQTNLNIRLSQERRIHGDAAWLNVIGLQETRNVGRNEPASTNFPQRTDEFTNQFLQQNPQRFRTRFLSSQRQPPRQFPTNIPRMSRWQGNRDGSVAEERQRNNGQQGSGWGAVRQNMPQPPRNVNRRQLQLMQDRRLNNGQQVLRQGNFRQNRPLPQGNADIRQSQSTRERQVNNRQQAPRSDMVNNERRFSTNTADKRQSQTTRERPVNNRQQVQRSDIVNNERRFSTNTADKRQSQTTRERPVNNRQQVQRSDMVNNERRFSTNTADRRQSQTTPERPVNNRQQVQRSDMVNNERRFSTNTADRRQSQTTPERPVNNRQQVQRSDMVNNERRFSTNTADRRQSQTTPEGPVNNRQREQLSDMVNNERRFSTNTADRRQSQTTPERPVNNRQQVQLSDMTNNERRLSTNHPSRFGSRNTQSTHNRENPLSRAQTTINVRLGQERGILGDAGRLNVPGLQETRNIERNEPALTTVSRRRTEESSWGPSRTTASGSRGTRPTQRRFSTAGPSSNNIRTSPANQDFENKEAKNQQTVSRTTPLTDRHWSNHSQPGSSSSRANTRVSLTIGDQSQNSKSHPNNDRSANMQRIATTSRTTPPTAQTRLSSLAVANDQRLPQSSQSGSSPTRTDTGANLVNGGQAQISRSPPNNGNPASIQRTAALPIAQTRLSSLAPTNDQRLLQSSQSGSSPTRANTEANLVNGGQPQISRPPPNNGRPTSIQRTAALPIAQTRLNSLALANDQQFPQSSQSGSSPTRADTGANLVNGGQPQIFRPPSNNGRPASTQKTAALPIAQTRLSSLALANDQRLLQSSQSESSPTHADTGSNLVNGGQPQIFRPPPNNGRPTSIQRTAALPIAQTKLSSLVLANDQRDPQSPQPGSNPTRAGTQSSFAIGNQLHNSRPQLNNDRPANMQRTATISRTALPIAQTELSYLTLANDQRAPQSPATRQTIPRPPRNPNQARVTNIPIIKSRPPIENIENRIKTTDGKRKETPLKRQIKPRFTDHGAGCPNNYDLMCAATGPSATIADSRKCASDCRTSVCPQEVCYCVCRLSRESTKSLPEHFTNNGPSVVKQVKPPPQITTTAKPDNYALRTGVSLRCPVTYVLSCSVTPVSSNPILTSEMCVSDCTTGRCNEQYCDCSCVYMRPPKETPQHSVSDSAANGKHGVKHFEHGVALPVIQHSSNIEQARGVHIVPSRDSNQASSSGVSRAPTVKQTVNPSFGHGQGQTAEHATTLLYPSQTYVATALAKNSKKGEPIPVPNTHTSNPDAHAIDTQSATYTANSHSPGIVLPSDQEPLNKHETNALQTTRITHAPNSNHISLSPSFQSISSTRGVEVVLQPSELSQSNLRITQPSELQQSGLHLPQPSINIEINTPHRDTHVANSGSDQLAVKAFSTRSSTTRSPRLSEVLNSTSRLKGMINDPHTPKQFIPDLLTTLNDLFVLVHSLTGIDPRATNPSLKTSLPTTTLEPTTLSEQELLIRSLMGSRSSKIRSDMMGYLNYLKSTIPPTTTTVPTTTPSPAAGGACPAFEALECVGVGAMSKLVGIIDFCKKECNSGQNCPKSMCSCACHSSLSAPPPCNTGTMFCGTPTALWAHKVGMDQWCYRNCNEDACDMARCQCECLSPDMLEDKMEVFGVVAR